LKGFYPVDDNCVDFYVCIEILPGILLADQVDGQCQMSAIK